MESRLRRLRYIREDDRTGRQSYRIRQLVQAIQAHHDEELRLARLNQRKGITSEFAREQRERLKQQTANV